MRWFLDLRTRTKLALGYGGIASLLLVVALTAIQAIRSVVADYEGVIWFRDLANNTNGQRVAVLSMLETEDAAERERFAGEVRAISAENDVILRRLDQWMRGRRATEKLHALVAAREEFKRTRDEEVVPLARSGRIAEARRIQQTVQQARFETIRHLAGELAAESKKRADAIAQRALWIVGIAGAVATLLAIVLTAFMGRVIAEPLGEITQAAEKIAVGDLETGLAPAERHDEVGVLHAAFARMSRELKSMAGIAGKMSAGDLSVQIRPQSERDELGTAFSAMAQSLRGVMQEILGAVNVASSSSAEITSSISQVAASSAEVAAAINETTTTVEEVKQTAQVASDKVRSVSDGAQLAARTSERGQLAVQAAVEGMERIRQQMDQISTSMARLSEQTLAIGDIIATVTDLAEQSNILAVNASIEAARAGEHGRGFSVVAQEVRSLADQSKAATTQVRTILSEIQRATSGVMMAMEQGSKAVDVGRRQSTEAGQAIVEMAGSIAQSAQAAAQIAASSQQQAVGMDQVAIAIRSIQEASVQNAAAVRQIEASAVGLKALGLRLKELVERFTV
jgi:methyl-accepting chemotaxis protein